jgi:hypothetical protein
MVFSRIMGYLILSAGVLSVSTFLSEPSILLILIAPLAIGIGVGLLEKSNDLFVYSMVSGFVVVLGIGSFALFSMIIDPTIEKLGVSIVAIPISSWSLYVYYQEWKPDLICMFCGGEENDG